MKTVIVRYDYASPWANVAYETIEKKLPGVPIEWRRDVLGDDRMDYVLREASR